MKHFVVLIGFFALSSAQLDVDLGGLLKPGMKFNVTDNVNRILPQMNEFVELKDMATVKLPDVKLRGKKEAADFTSSTFEGLDKMKTATKAILTLTRQGNSRVCTRLVFENSKLSVYNADIPLSWNIGSLVMDLSLTLAQANTPDGCVTQYNRIKVSNVSDVVGNSETANKDTLSTIIGYYNHWLKNPKILKKISSLLNICEPSSDTINQVTKPKEQN